MWLPWKNRTGLAKAAVVLAAILLLASVSCGVTWGAVVGSFEGARSWQQSAFLIAGYVEILLIAASLAGLLVVLVLWLLSLVRKRIVARSGESE